MEGGQGNDREDRVVLTMTHKLSWAKCSSLKEVPTDIPGHYWWIRSLNSERKSIIVSCCCNFQNKVHKRAYGRRWHHLCIGSRRTCTSARHCSDSVHCKLTLWSGGMVSFILYGEICEVSAQGSQAIALAAGTRKSRAETKTKKGVENCIVK